MDIILTREDYMALRPNALAIEVIEAIKGHLEKGPVGFEWKRLIDDIQESLNEYDKKLKRDEEDDNFKLWPPEQETAQETVEEKK